jgi:hypothetical protein
MINTIIYLQGLRNLADIREGFMKEMILLKSRNLRDRGSGEHSTHKSRCEKNEITYVQKQCM